MEFRRLFIYKLWKTLIFFLFPLLVFCQNTDCGNLSVGYIGGTLVGKADGVAIPFAKVECNGNSVTSSANGWFAIQGKLNDIIEVTSSNGDFKDYTIKVLELCKTYQMPTIDAFSGSGGGISTGNEWSGATLSTNLTDESQSLLGGAKLKISTAEVTDKFKVYTVGNISNIFSLPTDSLENQISGILQSNQGFNIGVSPEYSFTKNITGWITLGYKGNEFLQDSISTTLHQLRGSIGFDYQFLKNENNDRFSIGTEFNYSFFSESDYKDLFNESRKRLWGLQFSIIIPTFKNIGFMSNVTYSRDASPLYQIGLYIKPE